MICAMIIHEIRLDMEAESKFIDWNNIVVSTEGGRHRVGTMNFVNLTERELLDVYNAIHSVVVQSRIATACFENGESKAGEAVLDQFLVNNDYGDIFKRRAFRKQLKQHDPLDL